MDGQPAQTGWPFPPRLKNQPPNLLVSSPQSAGRTWLTMNIGGLTQDENIDTKGKVPLLGDIPIIGQVFHTDKSSRTKTELYIIVTSHIVHHFGARTVPANAPLYAPTTTTTLPMGSAPQAPPH